jgi:hypothetical protein
MSKEMFNPSAPEYKKVEDLPKEEQGNFANVEGGFVKKEAKEELRDAETVIEGVDYFKKKTDMTPEKMSKWRTKVKLVNEIKSAFKEEGTTARDVLRVRTKEFEKEVSKP